MIHLFIIDPQNDFCHPDGSLSVPGASDDMDRLAQMIEQHANRIGEVSLSLDSHNKIDISHPLWWKDSSGAAPPPFTLIKAEHIDERKWVPRHEAYFDHSFNYLKSLEAGGRYPHVVWPEHCLVGDEGHNIWGNLSSALHEWEEKEHMQVDYLFKGLDPLTEHFSAIEAEVPTGNPSTMANTKFVNSIEQHSDTILIAGEALSHCVANTVRDMVKYFESEESPKKIVLLTDAMSNVPNFDQFGTDFLSEMDALGVRTSTTVDFFQ